MRKFVFTALALVGLTTGAIAQLPLPSVNWGTGGSGFNPAFPVAIKADGSTDDSLALKTAVDSCAATGKTLYLPPGRIRLDATTVNLKNCNIVGQGVSNGASLNRGTTFLLTSTSIKPFVVERNWSMRGVNFYWPNQTTGAIVYPPLFSDDGTNPTSQVYMDDVVVLNAYDIVKLTTGLSQGPWSISNSYFYAVHDAFTVSNVGDSWRMTNIHFTPGPWIDTCNFCGSVLAAINVADQVNSMFHITGNGSGSGVGFISNSSAFAWRYGFLVDANAALFSDIQIAMDGTSTYLDTSSGGVASGSVFRGSGMNSYQAVYGGINTGNAPAFNLGANGYVTLDGIESSGRGTFIKTTGSTVIAKHTISNIGSANDGNDYYCFQNLGTGRLEIRNIDCYGQANANSHGVYSHTASVINVQDSLFLNLNDVFDITTTSPLYTTLTGNTSASTFGSVSAIFAGNGQIKYSGNNLDKPPLAVVSSCGVGATITGSLSGTIQVGTGAGSNCSITLPFLPLGGHGACTVSGPIGSFSTGLVSSPPPLWNFISSTAADISGSQLFYHCEGE